MVETQRNLCLGWIPRRAFPDFFTNHPTYEFRSFSGNGHSDDGYVYEKYRYSYKRWIRKNPFFWFSFKNSAYQPIGYREVIDRPSR